MRYRIVICLLFTVLLISGCRSSGAGAKASSATEVEADAESRAVAPTVVVLTATPTLAPNEGELGTKADAPSSEAASEIVATSTAVPVVSNTDLPESQVTAPSAAEQPSAVTGILPDRIAVPSINLDTPVVELSWHNVQADDGRIFSEWDVADQAAGWHKNSSLIGEEGNVVLSGHNNVLGAVFRELDQLKRGDEALLWADGNIHRYLVDKVMIVPEKYATQEQREANAAWIGHFEDDRLTLVSCWPRDDNSHRIIVVAYADESNASVSN